MYCLTSKDHIAAIQALNTYTSMTSSTEDAIGPIISTVPESHIELCQKKKRKMKKEQ